MTDPGARPAGRRAAIPARGRPHAEILDELRSFSTGDAKYREGRTWSLVYYPGDVHHAFLKEAYGAYFAENGLNPMAFRSLRRMESEVVQMTASMLHGPPTTVGSMTSGGTDSITMAVKTYRDRARAKWPWIRRPNLVMSNTAHPAFDKAGHLLGVRIRAARALPDGRADVAAMGRLVDRNTVMMVVSAPQYVVGTVDPVPEAAALAASRGVPLHVDACFGGFILPWLERIGQQTGRPAFPPWDFRVPGVTSISADVHKYGYAAKGASILVFRDMDYLRHQFFVTTHWPGGVYASAGFAGTRPGGPIAAAWGAMHAMGEAGYIDLARKAWDVAEKLRAGIGAIPALRVLGLPHATVVTWAARGDLDVYAVADVLEGRGWAVDRQQDPPSVHCSTNAANAASVDDYLADLRDAVAWVEAHPEASTEGQAAVYGAMSKVPIDGLLRREVRKVLERAYAPGGTVPGFDAGSAPGPIATRALELLDRVRRRVRG